MLIVGFTLIAPESYAKPFRKQRFQNESSATVGSWGLKLGLGSLGMIAGGYCGYVLANGGSTGPNEEELNALFTVIPGAIAGGVFGGATGVYGAGSLGNEQGSYWSTTRCWPI